MGKKKTSKKSPLVALLKKKKFVKTDQGGVNFFASLSLFFFVLSGLIFMNSINLNAFSSNELPENAFIVSSDGTLSKVENGQLVPVDNKEK